MKTSGMPDLWTLEFDYYGVNLQGAVALKVSGRTKADQQVWLAMFPYSGSGFRNTGLIGSLPPAIYSVTVKFTQKGTVPIRCLIHPEMKGEVKVG